jgi:addiction module HigA family antidote
MAKKLPPLHPGEVLREEFLVPLKMSAGALAKICGVPRTRIERLTNEQIGITADTALRLSKALRTTPELWEFCLAKSRVCDRRLRRPPFAHGRPQKRFAIFRFCATWYPSSPCLP